MPAPAQAGADPLAVEYRDRTKLKPFERNPRIHTPAQVEQIVRSIKEFGWTNPILIDPEGGIIAGHGRAMAAEKLGLDRVPVIVLGHLTEGQRRALVIADNKLALNSSWDENLLKLELSDLREFGYDLELTGFDMASVGRIVDGAPPANPNVGIGDQRHLLIIEFSDENQLRQGFEELQARGWTCKVMS